MHVLTIAATDVTIEIHILNPRQTLTPFGGSKSGLVVGKTASLVTRTIHANYGTTDVEHDIHSPAVWKMIAAAINQKDGLIRVATIPGEE